MIGILGNAFFGERAKKGARKKKGNTMFASMRNKMEGRGSGRVVKWEELAVRKLPVAFSRTMSVVWRMKAEDRGQVD